MEVFRTRIEADSKIQIPPQILEQLDFAEGQEVEIEVEKKISARFIKRGGTAKSGTGTR